MVVSRVPTPWDLAAGTSCPELDTDVFRQIVMPISFALDKWEQGLLREVAEGTPTNAVEALDFIAQLMAEEELDTLDDLPLPAPRVAPEVKKEVAPRQLSALEAAFAGAADGAFDSVPAAVPATRPVEIELEIDGGPQAAPEPVFGSRAGASPSQSLELAGSRSIRAGRTRARTAGRRPAPRPTAPGAGSKGQRAGIATGPEQSRDGS